MVKIFHTADLHLDSPFSSLPPSRSEQRRAELRNTFIDMMNFAAEEKTDIVLIPGDLFDSDYVSRDTYSLLCKGFEKLSCPVVICPGNHDPYTPDSIYATAVFPDNVHIFKSETPSFFDFPEINVCVWGAAFVRKSMENTPLVRIPPLNDGRINILCQHGDTHNLLSGTCPLNPRDIAYKGFTYAALGHIHIPPEPVYMPGTVVAYPGCPVGRSFDEPGFGSALSVVINENKHVTLNKVCRSDKRYMVAHLDVTGASDSAEIVRRISAMIASDGYGSETSLRIILEGEIPPRLSIPVDAVTEMCSENLGFLEIRDKTLPVLDAGYLENDMTLRGALYRELKPFLTQDDERGRIVAAEALRAGLAAIDNRAIFPEDMPAVIGNDIKESSSEVSE